MRVGTVQPGTANCLICGFSISIAEEKTIWDGEKSLREHLANIHDKIMVCTSVERKKSDRLILTGVSWPDFKPIKRGFIL